MRKILEDNVIPLDRLLVETDAPFMYPNTRASKLPQNVKDALTERYEYTQNQIRLAIKKFNFKVFTLSFNLTINDSISVVGQLLFCRDIVPFKETNRVLFR